MNSLATTEPDALAQFLNTLYGETPGWVFSPTLLRTSADKPPDIKRYWFQWPTHRLELREHILTQSKEIDVYISPALYKENTEAKKENVLGANVVWCEFDGQIPESESDGSGYPSPSLRIQSSEKGHEHWYWSLSEFVTDVKRLEFINRGLTYQLRADTSGWDSTQILRPPGTLNYKYGTPPLAVNLLQSSPLSYPLSSFAGLPEPPAQITEFNTGDALDALDVVAKYPWTSKHWLFFRTKPPVGERSTALMQLGYICAEMGMNDLEIFSTLYNADERWDKFKNRLDRARRLCDIIIRARVKVPAPNSNLQTLEVYGLQDLLNSTVEVKWTIQDLLQENGSLLLSGPPGLGKTQLSLHFAIRSVLKRGFLKYPAPLSPQRIIYFSLEMSHAGLKYFLSQMTTPLTPEELLHLQENLLLVPLGEALYLDKEQQQKLVEAVIEQHSPTGIFIDSLGSTTPDELSSETTAKAIFDWEQRLRNKYDIFVWWIHHNRKASTLNKTPNKLDDVYGNRYIQARPDSIISAWGQPGQPTFKLITLKQRYARTIPPFTVEREGIFFKVSESEGQTDSTVVLESEADVDYKEMQGANKLTGSL